SSGNGIDQSGPRPGWSCFTVSDNQFGNLQRNPGSGVYLRNGNIYYTDQNGNQVKAGSYWQTDVDLVQRYADTLRSAGVMADQGWKAGAKFMAPNAMLAAGGALLAPAFRFRQALKALELLDAPAASSPELEVIINDLFQATDRLPGGNAGGTLDSNTTGELVQGSSHAMKAAQQITRIEKLLKAGNLSPSDRAVAHQLIHDLRTGLGYMF